MFYWYSSLIFTYQPLTHSLSHVFAYRLYSNDDRFFIFFFFCYFCCWVTEYSSINPFILHFEFRIFHPQKPLYYEASLIFSLLVDEMKSEKYQMYTNFRWNDTFVGFLSFCLMHFTVVRERERLMEEGWKWYHVEVFKYAGPHTQ